MAVLEMQHICICALKKDRKRLLEYIQRQGVIEISEVIPEDSVFHKMDVSTAKALLEKNTSAAREAAEILDRFAPSKKSMLSMLNGRKEIAPEAYDRFYQKHDTVVHNVNDIIALAKNIDDSKAEILKLRMQYEMLEPWTSLDVPMNFPGTRLTSAFIGTLPNTWTEDMILEKFSDSDPEMDSEQADGSFSDKSPAQLPVSVQIISNSREQTCVFVLCLKQHSEKVSEILRAIGFSTATSGSSKAPAIYRQELERKIAEAEAAISAAKKEIEAFASSRDDIRFLEDFDRIRADKYEVIGNLLQSKHVFVITGYIPINKKEEISKALSEKFGAAVEFEQPGEDEDAPVLLANGKLARPLEKTVESFSLPGKGEIDPTNVMSIFFYVLFGLMFSDVGYGLMLAIPCLIGLLRFKKTLESSMRDTLRMYLICGISTIFWGVMFGSYFGDIVDVVSATFFRQKITMQPLWFFPANEPMRMLLFSMIVGIIHLYTGLAMKLRQLIIQKDWKAIIYDVIFWYILLTSSVVLLLSTQLFVDIVGLKFRLSASVGRVAGIVAAAASIGIIATNGRESKNPFKRFLKGLYALYGITGYLSDVLSYSRLLALGLATGVICTVVNKMAGMTAGSPIGIITFIIIFVAGHALNFGISVLGAYVHTTRLQYVEFFGKFYEGGGRKFEPFSIKSKYFKFREEQ